MKNNVGANIKTFRKNKWFTQEELAGMLGVTPQAVSRWESEAGLPDVSMIVPIAQALNITTDALLGYHAKSHDDRITEQVFAKMKEFEDVEHPGQSALAVCEYLAEEACDTYLTEIKGNGMFSETEYLAIEKEFREKIYIL